MNNLKIALLVGAAAIIEASLVGGMVSCMKRAKAQEGIEEEQRSRRSVLVSAYFQDLNLDGTNELIVADRSGRATPLFLYDSKSNQYFSAETIREMKANELENQMRNYTNSAEVGK